LKRIGKIRAILVIVFILAAILGGGYCWWRWQSGPAGKAGTIIELDVSSKNDLATKLASKHLVKSKLIFTYLWGKKSLPQKGYYSLGGTNAKVLVDVLGRGPNIAKVTIPEGFSVAQIAQRLSEAALPGDAFYGEAKTLEGKLFPDTYFIRQEATASSIIAQFTENYDGRIKGLNVDENTLILASIVEREAKKDEERPKIAALFKNRLNANMKLEADPTVQYARDLALMGKSNLGDIKLWQPLGSGVVHSIVSPYNTYNVFGLPPKPICNPGLASIKAALNPEANFTALYFFHDKNGTIHFSNSFDDHQTAIKQFGL
jgi:UPF0755 protein